MFGTVSNIDFHQESMRLAMGTSTTANLTLDLMSDFSLIDTRRFEIKAAFSASGSGQDTKILTRPGDQVVLHRGKVMQETSRSPADNAYNELMNQFGASRSIRSSTSTNVMSGGDGHAVPEHRNEPVTIYR